ncbi:MAG: hypothetical protein FWD82_04920 [Defluviitaleaceae bacterium]|nr:hypothetical protein [Defluviitaleaceae bacterium]
MKKSIVNLAEPIITIYSGYSNAISILLNYKYGVDWFIHNFLNIISVYDYKNNILLSDFMNMKNVFFASTRNFSPDNIFCPPIKSFSVPRQYLSDNKINIIDYIKYYLDNNYCCCFHVDNTYINYSNMNRIHDIFIYGYDDDSEFIYLSDNLYAGKYERVTCTYEELNKAYNSVAFDGAWDSKGIFNHFSSYEKLNFVKFDSNFIFSFDKKAFIDEMQIYINKTEYDLNYTPKIIETTLNEVEIYYNVKIYDVLEKYILRSLESKKHIDHRQIFLLHDHKNALNYKVKYLLDNGLIKNKDLLKTTKQLIKTTITLVNKVLKYNLNFENSKDRFEEYKILLRDVKSNELDVINHIVEELS